MQKIGIIGAHSTGKTTFAHALYVKMKIKHPIEKIKLITEVARGVPIHLSMEEKQLWILTNQISREIEAQIDVGPNGIIICDRTVLDNYAYWLFYPETKHKSLYIQPLINKWLNSYTQWFYTPYLENIANIDDGVRLTTGGQEVDKIIKNLISGYQLLIQEGSLRKIVQQIYQNKELL